MAKLFFALLCVALASIQINASIIKTELSAEERGWVDDLMKQAAAAIESLKNSIMDLVYSGLNQINGLKDQMTSMVNSAIDQAKKEFQKIIDSAQGSINEWKVKAAQLGIDIKECYVQSEEDLKNLPMKFLNNEIACVTSEYDAGMKIITESEEIINEVVKKYNEMNLSERLSQCMNEGWGAMTCIYGVIKDVASLTISMPTQLSGMIKAKVNEITAFITALPVRLQACATAEVAGLSSEATAIVVKVVDCAKEKLGMTKILLF